MIKRSLFNIVQNTILATALTSTSGCAYTTILRANEIAREHVENMPSLNKEEEKILERMKGDSYGVQNWIHQEVTYTDEFEQFKGAGCKDKESCEVWASVAHLLRTRREDCDGVLALAHYSLGKRVMV